MRRREFITLLGGAAVAWPIGARAQQVGEVHRIGFLGSATAAGSARAVQSLRTGHREFDYVEGANIDIEFRWAERNDGEFAASFAAIAELALANKLPSIGAREYAGAGGLIGYGVNILSLYRRAAYFVHLILKGAKPTDLPIEQPTKFDLIVNVKTANTIGLAISETFLIRADEVIE